MYFCTLVSMRSSIARLNTLCKKQNNNILYNLFKQTNYETIQLVNGDVGSGNTRFCRL